jgi:uncharacterized membrane protein
MVLYPGRSNSKLFMPFIIFRIVLQALMGGKVWLAGVFGGLNTWVFAAFCVYHMKDKYITRIYCQP